MLTAHVHDYDHLRCEGEHDEGAELCSVWCTTCRRYELIWIGEDELRRKAANDNDADDWDGLD